VDLRDLCSKHSRLFIREAEDFFLHKFLYPRILQASASIGFKIPLSEAQRILDGAKSRREATERMAWFIIGLLETQPELLTYERLHGAVLSDAMAQKAVALLKSVLGGRELRYEDAVAFTRECGLEKMHSLLTGFPEVSKRVLNYLNTVSKQK
jgi:hypothetical protein